jgi:hypothetical protein
MMRSCTILSRTFSVLAVLLLVLGVLAVPPQKVWADEPECSETSPCSSGECIEGVCRTGINCPSCYQTFSTCYGTAPTCQGTCLQGTPPNGHLCNSCGCKHVGMSCDCQ